MAERTTKILAIDDEEDNLRLFRTLLKKYLPDAEVRTATSGEDGLALIKEDPPALVLLDARMPGMDGFEVCRKIKRDPKTTNIPVLMVSGAYVELEHRLSGFEGGADGYLCKPFKTEELAAQIKVLLLSDNRAGKTPTFRAMVVDDSHVSRQVIMAELKQNPHVEVAVFEDVDAALAALDAVKPDLVISDDSMPGKDGMVFCREIRKLADYRDTPFILLSENADDDLLQNASDKGICDVLPKPFEPSSLQRLVSRHVNTRRDWFDHEVLVVEGTSIIRKMLKQDLTGMRLRVHEAANTNEAEKILKNQPVDLIIVDDALLGKTGLAWCKELRASDTYQWMPILGLSSDSAMSCAFIHAGANDYLSKDLVKEEIVIRVRNLLRQVSLTKQLNSALKRERFLNRQKNRLLGMAAHDIRAPLVAISGFAELIIDDIVEEPKERNNAVKSIHDVAREALDLLNNILNSTSIEEGMVELDPKILRLDQLLQERVAFMNEIGKKKGIHGNLEIRTDKNANPEVKCDKKRMGQVLDNILSNAVKYSEKDSDYTVVLDKAVEGWLIQVKDKGPGIPRDELLGIFDAFGKTSVQATGGEQSSGLGLAIAKKLVEIHRGTIWIDSEVGQGTTVSIVLPRYEKKADEENPADQGE